MKLEGVAAFVDKDNRTVAIGITGIAPKPYRARAVEIELKGKALTSALRSRSSIFCAASCAAVRLIAITRSRPRS